MKNYFYGSWLDDWYNTYKKPYIKSYKNIERNIRLHIPKQLKETLLVDLTALDIQKALNKLGSCRNALDIFDIYRGSLRTAYNLDLITKDITKTLIKPKHKRKLGSALSIAEQDKFLKDISKNRCRYAFEFLLFSGCRRGELVNITWRDVDWNNFTISIHGTKTNSSDRILPINDDLLDVLIYLHDIKGFMYYGNIFNFRPNYLSKQFNKICPKHKLHDLRHTFATRCIESGIQLKTISCWLGHSSIKITADIYSHLLTDFQKEEIKKLKF